MVHVFLLRDSIKRQKMNQQSASKLGREELDQPPTPQVTWVHQINAAVGAISFTTMVMVFGR
jgi:hypothetical protein